MKPHHKEQIAKILNAKVELIHLTTGQVGAIYRVDSGKELYVLKTSHASGALAVEAKMLQDMDQAGVRVPKVIAGGEDFLLMEYIVTPKRICYDRDESSALALLKLHAIGNDARMYGYYYDTPIASFWQKNEQTEYNWALFYGEMRLIPMAHICLERGYIDHALMDRIEKLVHSLHLRIDLASITPSLLHGDVWSGNVLYDNQGAVLIDPALYFGDREVDLAFIAMFSTFGKRFWEVYTAHVSLSKEYHTIKEPLYQLYPYLVHVALYGKHYLSGLKRCLKRLGV